MAIQSINPNRQTATSHCPVATSTSAWPVDFSVARDSQGQTCYLWMNTPLEELSSVKLCQLVHESPNVPRQLNAAIAAVLRLRGEEDLLQRWQPPH